MSDNEREKLKQRRRALIKAAAATPAVLTLPSGAALAAASLTCKDKSQTIAQADPPPGARTFNDDWMRYRVPAFSIKQPGGPVKGFEYPAGTWYKVDGAGKAYSINLQPGNGNLPTPTGGYYYLLVNYSSGQTFDSVYVGQQLPNPIAGASCWNSLTGAQLTNPPNLVN